jgi:hypothetical protein
MPRKQWPLLFLASLLIAAPWRSAFGVSTSGPFIDQVLPPSGGNAGLVYVTIKGNGLSTTQSATLSGPVGSSQDYDMLPPLDVSNEAVSGYFDLTGAGVGLYSVSVVDDQNNVTTANDAFEVLEGEQSSLWARVMGKFSVRWGSPRLASYSIQYGNRGDGNNVPSSAVLMIAIPSKLDYNLAFDLNDFQLPAFPDDPSTPKPGVFQTEIDGRMHNVIPLRIANVPRMAPPLVVNLRNLGDPSVFADGEVVTVRAWWAGSQAQ